MSGVTPVCRRSPGVGHKTRGENARSADDRWGSMARLDAHCNAIGDLTALNHDTFDVARSTMLPPPLPAPGRVCPPRAYLLAPDHPDD